MKKSFLLLALFILVGAGCTASQAPTAKEQTDEPAPIIGGTVRDPKGDAEACIINGDCDLGAECIEGQCITAEY